MSTPFLFSLPRHRSVLRAVIPAAALFLAAVPAIPAAPIAPPSRDSLSVPHRWERFPLRVYFAPHPENTPANRNAVRRGMDRWTTATNGALSYSVINDSRSADIVVQFVPESYVPPSPNTLGRTELSWQIRRGAKTGGILRRALIRLATGTPDDGPRAADLAEVAAHEWGHALGLNGHSPDKDDLMYAVSVRLITIGPGTRTSPPPVLHLPSPASVRLLQAAYPAAFSSAGAKTGFTSINTR